MPSPPCPPAGDLGYVRTFLLCGSIVMWLICAAVMLVVLGLSGG